MRPIRYGDIRQILTSVADTTVTIVSPTKRHFLITGSAAMYVLVLPDARTIRLGTPFVFENLSSEFVGVRNSDSTTWHRVPPRATLECVLATQATAAGTWYSMVHDPAVGNPAYGLSLVSDFGGIIAANIYNSEAGWRGVVSGGTVTQGVVAEPTSQQGSLRLRIAAIADYALIYNMPQQGFGGAARAFEIYLTKSAANAAVNENTVRAGFGDNITGGAHVNGAYFLNDFTNYGNVWVTRTISAATGLNTTNPTAVVPAVSPSYDKLRAEVSSNAARVDFFINKVLQFTHVANIPLVANPNNFGSTKVADANTRDHFVDYLRIQSYPTTPR